MSLELNNKQQPHLIYLARHGEVSGNVDMVVKDPFVEHLTIRGQEQAKLLGKHLENIKFNRIYCSDYPRAVETTNIVIANSKCPVDVEVNVDQRIREWDDSKFLGQSYRALNKLIGKGLAANDPYFEYSEFHVEGLEKVEIIVARLESFFDDLFDQLDKSTIQETVLIVCHGAIIRIFMKHIHLSKKYEANLWSPKCLDGLENCSYHKFSVVNKSDPVNSRILNFMTIHGNGHLYTQLK